MLTLGPLAKQINAYTIAQQVLLPQSRCVIYQYINPVNYFLHTFKPVGGSNLLLSSSSQAEKVYSLQPDLLIVDDGQAHFGVLYHMTL